MKSSATDTLSWCCRRGVTKGTGIVAADVVRHHARHGDFSRWLGDLCRDPRLVGTVQDIESAMSEASADELALLGSRLGATVREQLAASV